MSKTLDYIKGKIADLEDDLQHFTMVDKDKVRAFFIQCELDNLKLVEKELNMIKISTEKEELLDIIHSNEDSKIKINEIKINKIFKFNKIIKYEC